MNVGDKFNMNEKLILAYHESMNGHFELVKKLEIHNSSLNNNISNMQKKDNTTINKFQLLQHEIPQYEIKRCNG
jgi:DNA-binding MarR family transcriptional regulator